MTMDSTDLKIVSMLKKNARVSASAIAKEVGLAVSSVTERIRRLENTGVMDAFLTASRTPITLKEFDEINQYGSDYLTNDYWTVEKNSYGDDFTIFNYTPKAMAEQAIMLGWTAQYFAGSIDLDTCLQGMEADMQSQIGNAYE